MPAISAGAAIITGNKQAKASRKAADAQIGFAEDTRDLAIEEADRSYRQGSGILDRTSADLRGIYRGEYDATGGVIGSGFNALRGVTDNAYGASFGTIYQNRDDLLGTAQWGYDAANQTIGGAERDLNQNAQWRYDAGGQVIGQGFDDQMGVYNALRGDLIGEGGFEASPGYNFRRQEALDAVQASAAARGGLFSGATGKRLTEVADGYAADEWDRYRGDIKDLANMESGIFDWRTGAYGNLVDQYATDRSGIVTGIADARLGAQGDYTTARTNALDNAATQRLGLESGYADSMGQIYDWQTGALLNREGAFADNMAGVRAGTSDARLNLLANRTNARVGAGSTANATVANALSDRAIGQANAFTTQVNGITQGINNGLRLFGAFA